MATCISKIQFLPKKTSADFCLDKVSIIDNSNNWLPLNDFIVDGYISTKRFDSYAEINNSCWVKIRAISGYKIVSCYETNSSGTFHYNDFEIDTNGCVTVYPWQTGTATTINNYLYISVEEDIESTYTLTQTLEHCTSNAKQFYKSGENVSINLTCENGYKFDTIPTLEMHDTSYKFNVSTDRTTATIDFTVSNNMNITGIGTLYYTLTLVLERCTSNITSEVKKGVNHFVLTADSGYYFNDNIQLQVGVMSYNINQFSDGRTKCIFDVDADDKVMIEAIATLKTDKISNFANLYRVDSDILDDLSKARFYKFSGGSNVNSFDYGQYISSLYIIPFALDKNMIADNSNIQLGEYDSRVSAETLKTYNFSVNMGEIIVPEKYHNAYDYIETICLLHLPYCNTIQIDTHYVINHVLKLEYKIDLYSGSCTVSITSDITNEIVASTSFQIGSQIPFMQMQTGGTSSQLKQVLNNGVNTPYMEVVRNIPYNINTMFGRETIDYGKLENYQGFIKVSEIMLNINAKNDEKEEIISLLKSGVFINEKLDKILLENA